MIFEDANVIYKAMSKAIKSGDRKRRATQLYQVNHLLYTAKLQKSLKDGTYKPQKGRKFMLKERGKTRLVTNSPMADKTVNHIICDEILTPTIQKYLIFDNGASQKGKGVSFHRKRFEMHLKEYYKKYKTNDGYILFGDFSGYYANIRHDVCKKVLIDFLKCSDMPKEDLLKAWQIILEIFKTFRIDVSRFSDKEIADMYISKVDAMLDYGVDEKLLTGQKFLDKGIDIGNQTSQNIGIAFAYRLDNYAKIVASIHGYGRYTDDFYVIAPNKETLKSLADSLNAIAETFGIIINKKKTRIVKLSSFYRHLQFGYSLTSTGRVMCKINPKAITRERRKLKAYKRLLDADRITLGEIENIFKSWIANYYKHMSRQQIDNISELYKSLFREQIKWRKKHTRLHWLMGHKSAA